jgi:uncharacterized membrane protein YcaP (DUF421 family)
MGKRELSKVQPFELAIIILIADLASAPMASRGISIFDGIIPIITLLVAYIVFTIIIQANNKTQEIICGTISILIKDGKIDEQEMKKQQYTVSDLMEQLREKDIFKVQDVKFAILETNGKLNVIKNDDNMNKVPLNVIEDGILVDRSLKLLNLSKEDVDSKLNENKLKMENVLVGTIDENSKFIYQLKQEVAK